MIPLAIPDLSGNERKYLNECIDTTFVSSVGPFVDRLEKMAADIAGCRYAVATSSGTTGLHTALMTCGVGRDDLVIIPSFTFIATANAVSHCGATPWLLDIETESWTLSARQLKNELNDKTEIRNGRLIHKESGRKVATIMPVYTLGNIPDMDMIMAIAKEYSLPVIADAAAALGAKYNGKKVGEPADCTVFSFNGNKTVTSGGGGAIVTDNEEIAKKAKHISTTARISPEYDFDMVGYNYRMTNIQAAVGCAQLERVEEFVNKKRHVRETYNRLLSDLDGIEFFPEPKNTSSSCWFSGIVIKDGGLEKLRSMCKELKEKGIEARTFWKPIHLQEPYKHAIYADTLEVTDNIWDKILTLPCSTGITDDEIETVADTLRELLR
ncbi:MAG: LegC family aminotransferase [Lachnospiraceae bacterium]|nr:LegC family aminotransferase [Lachnospiraceae bacterium]